MCWTPTGLNRSFWFLCLYKCEPARDTETYIYWLIQHHWYFHELEIGLFICVMCCIVVQSFYTLIHSFRTLFETSCYNLVGPHVVLCDMDYVYYKYSILFWNWIHGLMLLLSSHFSLLKKLRFSRSGYTFSVHFWQLCVNSRLSFCSWLTAVELYSVLCCWSSSFSRFNMLCILTIFCSLWRLL